MNKNLIRSMLIIFVLMFTPITVVSAATSRKSSQYAITITKNPESQTARRFGVAEFECEAKGKDLQYQWYVKETKSSKWKAIKSENAKKSVYRFMASERYHTSQFRCVVKNKYKKKTSKSARLYISDIDMIYGYRIGTTYTRTIYRPIAVDGLCYVGSLNGKYKNEIKAAINTINKTIGKLFVYTTSLHTADIIIMNYEYPYAEPNQYTKDNIANILNSKRAMDWIGVAFSDDINYEHFLIGLNDNSFGIQDKKCKVNVIIHELGHCIGIPHSSDKNDIMYCSVDSESKMSKNDIAKFTTQKAKIEDYKNHLFSDDDNDKNNEPAILSVNDKDCYVGCYVKRR